MANALVPGFSVDFTHRQFSMSAVFGVGISKKRIRAKSFERTEIPDPASRVGNPATSKFLLSLWVLAEAVYNSDSQFMRSAVLGANFNKKRPLL